VVANDQSVVGPWPVVDVLEEQADGAFLAGRLFGRRFRRFRLKRLAQARR